MTDTIILGARSKSTNNTETGLAIRAVLGHTLPTGERPYRDLYTSEEAEYLWISIGDGDLRLKDTVEVITLDNPTKHHRLKSPVEVVSAIDENSDPVTVRTVGYGLSVVSDVTPFKEITVRYVGPRFMWSKNTTERPVFQTSGRWKKLSVGSKVLDLGIIGEDEMTLGVGSFSLEIIDSERFTVGSEDAPILVPEDVEGYSFTTEICVISKDTLKATFNPTYNGQRVFFSSNTLGVSGNEFLSDGDYLAGGLPSNERPLLREGFSGGFIEIELFDTEEDAVSTTDPYKARVIRSSGRLEFGSEITASSLYYEGVIHGISDSFERTEILGSQLTVRSDFAVSGISYVPDGTGITPTGVEPTGTKPDGSGLILAYESEMCGFLMTGGEAYRILLVDEVPRIPNPLYVYLKKSDLTLHWGVSIGTKILNEGAYFQEAFFYLRDWSDDAHTGIVLGLTTTGVKGFLGVVQHDLGTVSGNSLYQFIDIHPRTDYPHSFSIRETLLIEDQNYQPLYENGKMGWISLVNSQGDIYETTSEIPLDPGLNVYGEISVRLTQEVSEGVTETETLIKDTDYDLPLNGTKGSIRLKSRLGNRIKERGSEALDGVYLTGSELAVEGDWVVFEDGYYRQILQKNPDTSFILSSYEDVTLPSPWRVYEGSLQNNDGRLINAECLHAVRTTTYPSLVLRKTYGSLSALLQQSLDTSALYIRAADNLYPLIYLRPERLESLILDMSDPHISTDAYDLKSSGTVLDKDSDYTVSEEGLISFLNDTTLSDGVFIIRYPREDLTGKYETDGTTLRGPHEAEFFLEEISENDFNYEPSTGSVSLKRALSEGMGLEAVYTPTTTNERSKETLFFTNTSEVATRIDAYTYSFNPKGLGVLTGNDPIVSVGSELLGYGGTPTARYVSNTEISMPFAVPETDTVYITYLTSEASGGEQIFQTSDPILVPTIQVVEGVDYLLVDRDLTDEISPLDFVFIDTHGFLVSEVQSDRLIFTAGARYTVRGTLSKLSNKDIFLQVNGARYDAPAKSNVLRFESDLSNIIRTGCVLYIGNEVHRVRGVERAEGGSIQVSFEGITAGIVGNGDLTFYVSVRSVPLENDTNIGLQFSVVSEDPYVLVRYENGLGTPLKEGKDYSLTDGRINLKNSHRVLRGISYYLLYSALNTVGPRIMLGGRISYPNYNVSYTKSSTGSEYADENLYLTGTIESKDEFYVQQTPEDSYISSKSSEILRRGETSANIGLLPNLNPPEIGTGFEYYEVLSEDVLIRRKIANYDAVVSSLDDLNSTMTGDVVGDLSGKFRFDVRTAGEYGGAGLEDFILKIIEPRYVVMDLLGDTPRLPTDALPSSDAAFIKGLMNGQKPLIENEMDDLVLIGTRAVMGEIYGVYQQTWEPGPVSRLHPTSGKYYTTLFGGPYDSDSYGEVIGQVENNAREDITNISSLTATKRRFRFRIWSYSAYGFSEYPSTLGKHTLVLSAVPFKDFPLLEDGSIDPTGFLSAGGVIPDVIDGNPELSLPGVSVGSPVSLGKYGVGVSEILDLSRESASDLSFLTGQTAPRKVRVREVINPYVITLGVYDDDHNLVSVGDASAFDSVLDISKGDTLIEGLGADLDEDVSVNRTYRVGTDIGLVSTTGALTNITQSFPFNLFNQQNPPTPGTSIEGIYANAAGVSPIEYPALRGDNLNDDGEETVPYLNNPSERSVLSRLGYPIHELLTATAPSGEYVYPDEIRGTLDFTDGEIISDTDTLKPFTDGQTASVDLRQGDLLLIDLDDTGTSGSAATGFIEVASLGVGTEIRAPRFTSPISAGSTIRYAIDKFYRHTDYPTGLMVTETNPSAGVFHTDIYIPSTEDKFKFTDLLTAIKNSANSLDIIFYEIGTSTELPIINLTFTPDTANGVAVSLYSATSTYLRVTTAVTWFNFSTPGLALEEPNVTARHAGYMNVDVSGGSTDAAVQTDRVTFSPGYFVRSSSATLYIYDCDVTLTEIDGAGSQIISSNLNHVDVINGGSGFVLDSVESFNLILPYMKGHGNLAVARDNLRFSAFTGSEVDDNGKILIGEGYVIPNLSMVYADSISQGSLDNPVSGDLVYVGGGHMAGTYLIDKVYNGTENITLTGDLGNTNDGTLGSGIVFYSVVSITSNGDGTYDIAVDGDIDEAVMPGAGGISPLVIVVNPTDLTADPPDAGSVMFCNYESVLGNVFRRCGYSTFEGHFFVNSRWQNVPESSFYGYVNGSIGVGFITGHTRFRAPIPYRDSNTGLTYPYRIRDTGVGLVLTVTHTTLHGDSHVPYDFEITDVEYDGDGNVEFFTISYASAPILDTPNNYHAVLLPNDTLNLEIRVRQGLYLDTSFPRMNQDFAGTQPNYFGTAQRYGVARYSDFTLSGTPAFDYGDLTIFTVRRLRRFTDIFQRVLESLYVLPIIYNVREGAIISSTESGLHVMLETDGTNIGDLPGLCGVGDLVHILDGGGNDIGLLRIVEDPTDNILTLKRISGERDGARFRLEVRSGLVPEIQSYNKYLEASCFEIASSRTGNVDTENVLVDLNLDTGLLELGDYLVIDPQGALEGGSGPASPVEYGAPPQGDRGVFGETGYLAGIPSELDDNRGVYKVIGIPDGTSITVSPVTYSPDGGWNMLPTVGGLNGDALRVTAQAGVDNSYLGNLSSVGNFTYRIFRARPTMDVDLLEKVLFFRERTLSWSERLGDIAGVSGYDWDAFISEGYVGYVGREDRSHPSNGDLLGLEGEVSLEPYVNSDTCLSILDRRVQMGDPTLVPTYGETGMGIPTTINSLLESSNARALRWRWINARVDLSKGSLPRLLRSKIDPLTL